MAELGFPAREKGDFVLLIASAAAASEATPWWNTTYADLQGLNPLHLAIMAGVFWTTLFFVARFAIRPLLHVIEAREAQTKGAREEAADLESKLNERLKVYESRLAETRQLASEERARIRALAASEVGSRLAAARNEATVVVEQVRSSVEAERTRVRAELSKQAEALAEELVEAVLGREVSSGSAPRREARGEVRS